MAAMTSFQAEKCCHLVSAHVHTLHVLYAAASSPPTISVAVMQYASFGVPYSERITENQWRRKVTKFSDFSWAMCISCIFLSLFVCLFVCLNSTKHESGFFYARNRLCFFATSLLLFAETSNMLRISTHMTHRQSMYIRLYRMCGYFNNSDSSGFRLDLSIDNIGLHSVTTWTTWSEAAFYVLGGPKKVKLLRLLVCLQPTNFHTHLYVTCITCPSNTVCVTA